VLLKCGLLLIADKQPYYDFHQSCFINCWSLSLAFKHQENGQISCWCCK